MNNAPLLFGHRGSAVLAPENTEVAFDLALEYGASVLETDVRTSSDGIPVIYHDAKLDRITNGSGFVSNYTLDELKQLDAAYHFKSLSGTTYRGAGIRLMTLEEMLVKYADKPVSIEIKHPKADFSQSVAAVINKTGRADNVTVSSFHSGVTEAFRKAAPHVATAATRDEILAQYYSQYKPANLWQNFQQRNAGNSRGPLNDKTGSATNSLPYQTMQIPTRFTNSLISLDFDRETFIRLLHRQKLSVTYWTINNVEEMVQLAKRGADGLVTDRIDLAAKVFNL